MPETAAKTTRSKEFWKKHLSDESSPLPPIWSWQGEAGGYAGAHTNIGK